MLSNTHPEITFEAKAYQSFARSLRNVWRTKVYRAAMADATKVETDSPEAFESRLADSRAYQLYGWLERYSQQYKYLGHWGMVSWLERQGAQLEQVLEQAAEIAPERLHLDPSLAMPDYVAQADTHQHPGGAWRRAVDAFVFEWATSGVSFSMLDAEAPMNWYAAQIADRFAPSSVLELGCSCGKSSRAVKRALPNAAVHAADVSGPMVTLAHLRAVEQGLDIDYWQASAEKLPFADGRFDVASAYWLFHEMPPSAIRRALREMRRVTRAGGGLVLYDLYLAPGGKIGEWLHWGYSARNNEPFAHAFSRMDLKRELADAGYGDVSIEISEPQRAELPSDGTLPTERTHFMTLVTATAVGD